MQLLGLHCGLMTFKGRIRVLMCPQKLGRVQLLILAVTLSIWTALNDSLRMIRKPMTYKLHFVSVVLCGNFKIVTLIVLMLQVWSSNMQDNSEDIAKKNFMELEKHTSEIEHTKASIKSYVSKNQATIQNASRTSVGEFNVNDLLAQGEEVIEKKIPSKNKVKARKRRDHSDSEVEDWEEVNGMISFTFFIHIFYLHSNQITHKYTYCNINLSFQKPTAYPNKACNFL